MNEATTRGLAAGSVVVALFMLTLASCSADRQAIAPDGVAFMGTYGGAPLTWNACEPISWAFNADDVPDEVRDSVHEAVRTIASASGFTFDFVGYTDSLHPMGMRAEPPPADIHIEIVPDQRSDVLAMGDWGATDLRHERGMLTGAVIALNADGYGYHQSGFGPGSWHSLAVHELGHVLGLDHSQDFDDLMHRDWSQTPGVLSERDIAGVRYLRAQSDC